MRCRRHRRAGCSSIYSRLLMPSQKLTSPFTVSEVRELLSTERPELLEEWTEAGTVGAELERVAANATWTLAWMEPSSARWISTLRETGQLRAQALEQAIWLATRDDLYEQNTFDRDPDREPLDETQLRSDWFST